MENRAHDGMKILHIIASANPSDGGPIEGAFRLGEALAKQGHTQDLFTLDDPDADFLKTVPAKVIAIGDDKYRARGPLRAMRQRFGLAPAAVPALRRTLADYDIAIVAGLWNYSTMVARRVLVGSGIPYVVFTHGMLDPWFKRYRTKHLAKQVIWPLNEGVLLREAVAVMFTCEEERLLARTSYRPYSVREHVVGYGTADVEGNAQAQITEFRAELPALGDRPYLLFLSRIHEKKGCDILIKAFAEISGSWPGLQLVIAGPDQHGLRPTLNALAAKSGVTDRIHWPGMISGDVKWGAFRGCEAFVLPTHQENFGVVLAEAMACARPVLTTNKVNIWREIEIDQAGMIFNDDVTSTIDALRRFIAMPTDERDAMGARGRASFLRRFQIDSFAGEVIDVLGGGVAMARKARAL